MEGISIIPVVLFAYIFQGMYTNFIAGIYIEEKNKSLPLITGLGAATNIIVNLILIPIMGIMGAAIATLAAYIVMAVAIYRVSQKAYPIKYDWMRVGKLFLIVLTAYGVERVLVLGNITTQGTLLFTFRLGLTVLVLVALFGFGFFSDREKKFLREIGKKVGLG